MNAFMRTLEKWHRGTYFQGKKSDADEENGHWEIRTNIAYFIHSSLYLLNL